MSCPYIENRDQKVHQELIKYSPIDCQLNRELTGPQTLAFFLTQNIFFRSFQKSPFLKNA